MPFVDSKSSTAVRILEIETRSQPAEIGSNDFDVEYTPDFEYTSDIEYTPDIESTFEVQFTVNIE